jgi:hypothetical protein
MRSGLVGRPAAGGGAGAGAAGGVARSCGPSGLLVLPVLSQPLSANAWNARPMPQNVTHSQSPACPPATLITRTRTRPKNPSPPRAASSRSRRTAARRPSWCATFLPVETGNGHSRTAGAHAMTRPGTSAVPSERLGLARSGRGARARHRAIAAGKRSSTVVGYDDTVLHSSRTHSSPARRDLLGGGPGEDAHDPLPHRAARRVDADRRRLRDQRRPVRPRVPARPGPRPRARRRHAHRVGAPQSSVRREAGHPGHLDRRPHRRGSTPSRWPRAATCPTS